MMVGGLEVDSLIEGHTLFLQIYRHLLLGGQLLFGNSLHFDLEGSNFDLKFVDLFVESNLMGHNLGE